VAEQAGQLDGIVMIPPRVAPLEELFPEAEQWQHYFSSAFIQPMAFLKTVLEAQGFPKPFKIVMLSGLSSVSVLPQYGATNAMRLAWLGQSKCMAVTLAEQGVRVNTVSPGAVLTDSYKQKLHKRASTREISFEQQLAIETENIPTGRYSTPEDVAQAVFALLGPLSDQITGQNFVMDGGFFRGY
jgi:3-oxoacyl-[acyl-carrier protein] reductase